MGRKRKNLGKLGEDEAVKFLRKNGYKILERNYRTPLGEIDIITQKGEALAFVEVRSASSPSFGPPYLSIDLKKRRHIIKTALIYLKERDLLLQDARFDIVSISFDKGKSDKFELIENAFGIEGWWF